MTIHDVRGETNRPRLSICIPTYNRAPYLDRCLSSLEKAIQNSKEMPEIVVSDNASADDTSAVAESWSSRIPLRYVRNPTNIGGENNFFSSARIASTDYVWIFGDDDEFGETAVSEVFQYIDSGYDLILSNYSSWSKNMDQVIAPSAMSQRYSPEYRDRNLILSTFGILMGYISSIIVRKEILLSTPESEYRVFVPFGFPFPYCIYSGLPKDVRMAFISTPLFRRREHNTDFDLQGGRTTWLKYFSEGPALVFEGLQTKGYPPSTITRAKATNLRDFGIGNILSELRHIDRKAVRTMMYPHYRWNWRFWFVWLPFLLVPPGLVELPYGIYRRIKHRQNNKHNVH